MDIQLDKQPHLHQVSQTLLAMGRKSLLSMRNKLLLYNTVFKPLWAHGLQLWGTASKSNLAIMERCQTKVLRTITNTLWFVNNKDTCSDLDLPNRCAGQ